MYERQVFRDGWRLAGGGEAMDREQLGRPVVETGGVECPATGVREPLSLRQVELGLPAFFDVEVDPDPIEERSVVPSESLGATEEPAVMAFGVANPKTHLARRARAKTVRPNPPRLFAIVRMQQGDMSVPRGASVDTGPEGMV